MNRYLEIARRTVPDRPLENLGQRRFVGGISSPLGVTLRLIFEVFPGAQVIEPEGARLREVEQGHRRAKNAGKRKR